jgi:hypothetical protein
MYPYITIIIIVIVVVVVVDFPYSTAVQLVPKTVRSH